MKIRTETVVDVDEWDKLVLETYGRPYQFQQQEDCRSKGIFKFTVPDEADESELPDTIPEVVNGPEMGVKFAAWLARDPLKGLDGEPEAVTPDYAIKLWWHRNFYPTIQMVANDLHVKGLLAAGEYLINIDW